VVHHLPAMPPSDSTRQPADLSAIQLSAIQLLRKPLLLLATICMGAAFIVVGSKWPEGHFVHEAIEWIGATSIFACIVGRTWCSLYIAGRKDVSLVTVGPYSVCRNPLYLFSILGAFGVGAQLGSFFGAVIAGVFAWFLLQLVVLQEEKILEGVYGAPYDAYCERVPRFLPRMSLWRAPTTIEVDMPRVTRTFVDACVFLLAVPAAEAFEYLQNLGYIPVLLRVF
jgi:protein-S-isoprenylcysteine O-methyltransferase Ste14